MRTGRLQVTSNQVVLGLAMVVLGILVVYPLWQLLVQSLRYDNQYSLQSYVVAATAAGNLEALWHSLEVSIAAMLGATALGTCLAWLVARTDLPSRGLFRTAFVLPFLIPPFIGAMAWMQVLGPVGYVNKAWMALTGATEPLWSIYGPGGIILVMMLHEFPTVFITVLGGLERMNPELEEAAQVSGARVLRVMREITLPLMAPTIAAGALLVFVTNIANFGIPAILGFPSNYFVLTTKIYDAVTHSTQANNLSIAAALSGYLALISGLGILLQRTYVTGQKYAVISGKSMQPNVIRLGRSRPGLVTLAAGIVLVTTVIPVVAIVLTSLVKAYGLPPLPGNMTLQNYYDVLVVNRAARRGIQNSIGLALVSATAIMMLSGLIAYVIVKTKTRGRALLDFVASAPYTLPGTVVAIAMILAWLRPIPIIQVRLYNTLGILLVAYVARYLAFGVRTACASLAQVHDTLEEAARVSGASWLRTFRDIVVPLIRPGLFAGWFMVFIPVLRELTISSLLWSSGNETIGVMVFNLQQSGNTAASAALAVIMMIVLVALNVITRRLSGGKLGY